MTKFSENVLSLVKYLFLVQSLPRENQELVRLHFGLGEQLDFWVMIMQCWVMDTAAVKRMGARNQNKRKRQACDHAVLVVKFLKRILKNPVFRKLKILIYRE